MTGIRVTYSGLISFAAGIFTIITGLGFMIIVTRMLSPSEYGTWGVITGLLVYAMVFDTIIGYWAQRDIARDKKSGKTAFMSSGIISILGIIVYFIASFVMGTQNHLNYEVLLLAIILVPLRSFNKIITAINAGWKPEANSYATLIAEIFKIPIGIILLYFMELKIEGVILTFMISLMIGVSIRLIFARKKIHGEFKKELLTKWFRLMWIPIIPKIVSLLRNSDIIIYSVITGSVLGVAYFSASLIIASLSEGAGSISGSIVSKLLQGEKEGYMEENIRLLFYVLIPFTAFSLSFSKAGLFILNPIYEVAYFVVVFLSIHTVVFTLSNTFTSFLYGIEEVDKNEKTSLKNYAKSKLFSIPMIKLIQYTLYIISLSIVLILQHNQVNELELVLYWSVLSLIFQIPVSVYLYSKVQSHFKLKISSKYLLKYGITSAGIFITMFLVIENFIEFNVELIQFLPKIIILAIISFVTYFVITYLIDKKTRILGKLVFSELKKK
jgi:O-antigen/teichoic acid export membrane protein